METKRKAHARITAAAPKLFAALEAIEHTAISGLDGDAHAALEDIVQTAQRALVEAKGGVYS